MDPVTFYEEAKKPDAPDEIVLDLRAVREDPELTFSREGFGAIADQFHDYALARTHAYWIRTGKAPKHLRAFVSFVFDDEDHAATIPVDAIGLPWYALEDDKRGITQADGRHRLPRVDRDG